MKDWPDTVAEWPHDVRYALGTRIAIERSIELARWREVRALRLRRLAVWLLQVLVVAALTLAGVAAFAVECSGLYTREDGAYAGMSFGLTTASRNSALDNWCGGAPEFSNVGPYPACVIVITAEDASSFTYTFDLAGDGSPDNNPQTFTDNAGWDCTNPNFNPDPPPDPPPGPITQAEAIELAWLVVAAWALAFGARVVARGMAAGGGRIDSDE